MNCSGKNIGNWCHDLPTHYIDPEGKKYCLFHTPKGFKKVSSGNEFNVSVYEKIANDLKEKRYCNLSGTIFDWEINFKYIQIKELIGDIDFSHTNFYGEVNMRRKVFTGHVDFSGVQFHNSSDFDSSNFVGPCSFKKAVFKEQPCFFDTVFNEAADFSGANFQKGGFFTWGALKKGGDFSNAIYGANLVFKRLNPE